jgi:NADP-dependent 3-hydroxy acid dehydrogenase YdfG
MPQALLERLQGRRVGPDDRREHQGRAVRHRRGAAVYEGAESRHIINVAPWRVIGVGRGFAVYAATKYAVRALSEGLRREVKPHNSRTTVISPGSVATELPQSVTDPDAAERIRKFYCGDRDS